MWVLQVELREYLKWSIVIRQKLEWLRWQNFCHASQREYSATGPERRQEWVGRKGKGMSEFQWLIACMPLSTTPVQKEWSVVEVDPEVTIQRWVIGRSQRKWDSFKHSWFPLTEKKSRIENEFSLLFCGPPIVWCRPPSNWLVPTEESQIRIMVKKIYIIIHSFICSTFIEILFYARCLGHTEKLAPNPAGDMHHTVYSGGIGGGWEHLPDMGLGRESWFES